MTSLNMLQRKDGTRYQITILVITLLSFGQIALALLHIIPFWFMAFTMPVLIPRWMIAVHEISHIRQPQQVDVVTQLLPLAFTPFVLGYREYQKIHNGHHKFMCTRDDPEFFQLRGGYINGFLNAMTMPEQAPVRWIVKHGMDIKLVVTMVINAVLFFGLVYLAGWNFLWYWIPVRISNTISNFAFFYMLHRRDVDYGVYSLKLPVFVSWLFAIVVGKDAVNATCYHDVHHSDPRIACNALKEGRYVDGVGT